MAYSVEEVDKGIEYSIYSIRECLMEYYKGDCVDRVIHNNVSMRSEFRILGRNSERSAYESEYPCTLDIESGRTILKLQHDPNTVTFLDKTLNRSKIMRGVRAGIEDCLEKYLPHVQIVHEDSGDTNWRYDKHIVVGNIPAITRETDRFGNPPVFNLGAARTRVFTSMGLNNPFQGVNMQVLEEDDI